MSDLRRAIEKHLSQKQTLYHCRYDNELHVPSPFRHINVISNTPGVSGFTNKLDVERCFKRIGTVSQYVYSEPMTTKSKERTR